MNLDDNAERELKANFHTFPIKAQRILMSLYDPDIVNRSEPFTGADLYDYVKKNILVSLSEQEFKHIEAGFRLRWNYASGKIVGDRDFKQAVGQYLAAIEYPVDLMLVDKVVDLILEYLEWIGQWK